MTDKLVDLIGIGNLLESLVTEDVITCEERDQIMAKIAKENGIAEHEYKSPHIAGYGMSKRRYWNAWSEGNQRRRRTKYRMTVIFL